MLEKIVAFFIEVFLKETTGGGIPEGNGVDRSDSKSRC